MTRTACHTRLAAALGCAAAVGVVATSGTRAQNAPSAPTFHHVHMNVVDPERSIAFYASSFDTHRTMVAGWPGVQAENIYILFNKVPSPLSNEWDTPIWHFGWNTGNAVADYERLAAKGVKFFRTPPPSGHLIGPDGNDIEIAPGSGGVSGGTGPTTFNHVHLESDAPLCAADWYERVLGLRRGPSVTGPPSGGTPAPPLEAGRDCHIPLGPRHDPANQIHEPNSRVYAGDIMLFIYPHQRLAALTQRAVDEQGPLVSPRGRLLDHIALGVADVPATITRLRAQNVRILQDVHPFGNTTLKAAMIEGPDTIAIELVEQPPSR